MSTNKKILSPVELVARVEELENLLKAINQSLEVIEYSGKVDGSVAARNLASEAMDWIKDSKLLA